MKKIILSSLCMLVALSVFAQSNAERITNQYELSRMRIGIDVAYSYRYARAVETGDDHLQDFIESTRDGISLGFELHGFAKRKFGAGFKLLYHNYSHSDGYYSDKVNTFYFAPSILWRFPKLNDRNALILGLSLGAIVYYESISIVSSYDDSFLRVGSGLTFDFGYDIRLSGKTYLGIKTSLFSGSAKIEDNAYEKLNALSIGVGLRF